MIDVMKRVQLVERSKETGRIIKNESYLLNELSNNLMLLDHSYFTHWLYGRGRRKTLYRIIEGISALIDLDEAGRVKRS